MHGAAGEGKNSGAALDYQMFPPLTDSPVFRLISGASHRSGNPDLELFERSVKATVEPVMGADTLTCKSGLLLMSVLYFRPTLFDTTGSTGGARQGSVDSVGR